MTRTIESINRQLRRPARSARRQCRLTRSRISLNWVAQLEERVRILENRVKSDLPFSTPQAPDPHALEGEVKTFTPKPPPQAWRIPIDPAGSYGIPKKELIALRAWAFGAS